MQVILQNIYRFKFTLIYSVGFFMLGGIILGIPALSGGLLIDWIMNKCRQNPKDYPIKYWFIYVGIVGVLYPIVIFAAIDPDTTGGIIYNWIRNTENFTNAMASLVPAIDVYAKQIADFGDSWRVPKFRHLYAVFWFTNIVATPLLYGDVVRWIKYVARQPLEGFRNVKSTSKSWVFKFNVIMLIFNVFIIVITYSIFFSAYVGKELPRITYLKGYYLFEPFILFQAPICSFMCLVTLTICNVKYIIQRRSLRNV